MPPLAEQLAEFARDLRLDAIPERERAYLTRLLADTLACGLAAHSDQSAQVTLQFASPDATGATALVSGDRVRLADAALANTTAVRALDANDIYMPPPGGDTGHFSDAIPALLALAETHHATGADLLTAIAAAYEAQALLCENAEWMARGWHTASLIAWVVPITAARLAGLSSENVVRAVGIAGSTGQALKSWTRPGVRVSAMKSIAPGLCASRSIEAITLARAGITAPSDALEVMLRQLGTDPEQVDVARLGQHWTISRNLIKRYPAQFNTQAAIQAGLALHARGIHAGDIERVTITGHQHVCAGVQGSPVAFRPESHEDADHSTPFVVATALLHGRLTPAEYEGEPWHSPETLALMDKITLLVDPIRERARVEQGLIGCQVTVTTRDGAQHPEEVRQPLGHPDAPLDDAGLLAKMGELLPHASDACERLLAACRALDVAPDVGELLAACAAVREIMVG